MKNKFENTLRFAKRLDHADSLKSYRSKFFIPVMKGKPVIYFSGNSLGLQPKQAGIFIQQELKDWANLGVEGHEHARRPWLSVS